MMEPEPAYRLSCPRRFAYGVGHVLNDLCASMWFSYLLVFYHHVINFSNSMAGYLMLLGQVADAIATPLIGYETDRTNGFCGYSKRKSWHLIGTICVVISFPFLYMNCISCSTSAIWAQFIYYAPMVVIFQIGWAATQISHLSLIPDLTPNKSERVELNAIRYAFTVVSNIVIYVIAWFLLDTSEMDEKDPLKSELSTADAPHFKIMALSAIGIGLVFSLVFHLGTNEKNEGPAVQQHIQQERIQQPLRLMIWKDWLKEPQFYQIALLYMCTRLVVNLSQIYMPMFLTDSIKLDKQYIAIVPLVVFLSGFITSFIMRPLNSLIGRKFTYFIGALIIIGACTWNWFVRSNPRWEIFGSAILLGAGCSTILITSLSMTADLIGCHSSSGAFVYGSMSFTDKISNGIAVVLIQHLHPCKTQTCCAACVWYYKYMMVLVPGGIMIAALIVLLTLARVKIGNLRMAVGNYLIQSPETTSLLQKSQKSSDDDCCSYWFCLGTSKDEQAKIIQTDSPDEYHQTSYDSFADHLSDQPSSSGTANTGNGIHPAPQNSHQESPNASPSNKDSAVC